MSETATLRPDQAASSLDDGLVALMAAAAYEASRPADSSRPPWPATEAFWREACRREMAAALVAARRAGFRIDRP